MWDKIVLFGDSITQGSFSQERGFAAGAELTSDYQRRLDVVCRGFSGYTTVQAVHILPHTFPPAGGKVRLLVIFFGANDATPEDAMQHVPLHKYKENLKKLVTHPVVKEHGSQLRVMLITPSAINEHDLGTPGRTAENTQRYAAAVKEVARECNVACADLWSDFMSHCGWKEGTPLTGSGDQPRDPKLAELLYDGLHFAPAGYQVLYHTIKRTIASHFPELVAESMPLQLPPWDIKPALDVTEKDLFGDAEDE